MMSFASVVFNFSYKWHENLVFIQRLWI